MIRPTPQAQLPVIALAAMIFAAACSGAGSGSAVDTTAAGRAEEPIGITIEEAAAPLPAAAPAEEAADAEEAVQAEPVASDLPEITVIDVNSGGEFVLADLAPSDRPILLWMWAPH